RRSVVRFANRTRGEPLMALFLDEAQVRGHLDPRALLAAVRQALIALSRGEVTQPLRMVVPMQAEGETDRTGMLVLKPAQVGSAPAAKLITLAPGNAARGLPTLLATVVLMDPRTGETLVVMEGAHLTALRTAAATAVAADALCTQGPKV